MKKNIDKKTISDYNIDINSQLGGKHEGLFGGIGENTRKNI